MLTPAAKSDRTLPDCLTRDRLSSPYFPNTRRSTLMLLAVLCGVFVFTSFNRLNHTDLWGHLCYGRWIAEHYALPSSDPFGAVASGQPFVNTAWLAQWIGYETQRLGGEEGLVCGHSFLATLGCGLLMAAVHARGVSLPWAAVAGVFAYVLALPITGTIRPQLFGMVGFPCVLLACSLLESKRHPLVWLPIVMAFWANLHGSFLMGLAVLGGYAISLTFSRAATSDKPSANHVARAWLALGLSLAAVCVNPVGPNLLLIVASFGRNEVLSSISEWAALSTEKKLTLTLFCTSAVIGVLALLFTPRRRQLFELLLLALFAVGTISAIRMLAWWAFVWPWIIVPHLAAIANKWREGNTATAADQPTAMQTVIGIGIVFASLLIAPCSHALISGRTRGLAQLTGQGTPLYVADEMARRELTGKFFAPMDWSDYLLWQTHHRLQPLVYTHVHLVSPALWHDYGQIAAGTRDWETLARKHQLQYVLADRDPKRKSDLSRLIWLASRSEKPTTRILYQDQRCVLVELLPQKG